MPNGIGRAADFNDGSERVREPQFQTRQRVSGAFRPTSVLDQLLPSANGLSQQDYQRQIMGVRESPLGRSETTYDKSLWIREKKDPVPLFKTFG